ncbi:hypothetical protein GJ744_001271 [Endocarpon pusillum]|uniref:F-box domain-containing protein n=1 Tax=Endocarpon pusillum TaxID=364733 RepID=A0A8H7AC99_9EURO|nr:hypothetical protein GJ744_001271 [Endocarpon pusillum]
MMASASRPARENFRRKTRMLERFRQQFPLPEEILDQTFQYLSSGDRRNLFLVCKRFFNVASRIARTDLTCLIAEPTCLDPTRPLSDKDDTHRSHAFKVLEDERAIRKIHSLHVLGRNLPAKGPNQIVVQAELRQRQRLTEYHRKRLFKCINNAQNLRRLTITGDADISPISASHNLTAVVDIQIDTQPRLDFLQNFRNLRILVVVCVSETYKSGKFGPLPSLPNLQLLKIRFDKRLPSSDAAESSYFHNLVNLSLLKDLKTLELLGFARQALWSHFIIGSSNSMERLSFERISLLNHGWRSFYSRIASGLRSLTLVHNTIPWMGPIVLPVLEALEIEGDRVTNDGYIEFICPRLTLFKCTIRHSQASLSSVLELMISQFTATLETFMLRHLSDSHTEILTPHAVRTFSRCHQLRNFLFEGGISILTPDWWVLREIHVEADMAIFIMPEFPQSRAQETFRDTLKNYPFPDRDILSGYRGFLSRKVGSRYPKHYRCALHELRRFLREVDKDGLLKQIPDRVGNCACLWNPTQGSAFHPIEIGDCKTDSDVKTTIHHDKYDHNDHEHRRKRLRV